MTTIFDGYDEEYKSLAQSVSSKISEIASYEEEPDKRRTAITHATDLLTQASQLQMELEVRSLDAATKRELSKKVDQYKKSLKSLSDDLKNIKAKEDKEGLFGSAEARSRMAGATQKYDRRPFRLIFHRMLCCGIDCNKLATASKLLIKRCWKRRKWPSVFKKNLDATVKGVNDMARSGGRILGRMSARDKRQKLILYGVMGFMVLAILIVLFTTIFGKS
ncbi:hypothetical protein DYB25_014253 [Aphanomyces astaci]|uniref:Vesicle transport v-SNARE N-terminal domain-containing protein n=1 Tax=Aphanomyces astaci TaxID=112090 RepID=A0A396ZQU6_APHAT|nr:hypothetical protein DYB25_014253 [Aphanomyces astaci]RHY84683.1 hypothetical protein DYB35_014142 [Aphanomyces astaci]